MKIGFAIPCPKIFLSGIIFLVMVLKSPAQGLTVGDRFPEIEIKNILNYSAEKITLSAFRGKAVVLDIWSTLCVVCVAGFPKLDSFQKAMKNDIQIILVTHEKREKVKAFFNQKERLRSIKLPSVVNDTIINLILPHIGVPHQVWIDKDGFIRAITDGQQTSLENLKLLAQGKSLDHLQEKKSNFKYSGGSDPDGTPLISVDYGDNFDKHIYYTYISKYRSGISSGITMPKLDLTKKLVKISAVNVSIEKLYQLAYREIETISQVKTVRLFNDPLKLKADLINKTNLFCYELLINDTSVENSLQQMRRHLDSYFNIKSCRIKGLLPCLVLRSIAPPDKIRSRKNLPTDSFEENGYTTYINVPFRAVKNNLSQILDMPMIDETGIRYKVDLKIPSVFTDIITYNEALAKYGLTLLVENRIIEMIGLMDP